MRGSPVPYWLAGVFLICSPLSVAADLSSAGAAKYVRLGSSVLIVLWGMASADLFRWGPATSMCLPFVTVWTISPLWSSSPLWGLMNKGMFTLAFLSGVVLAMTPRKLPQLEAGLRFLGVISAAAALLVLYEYLTNPEGSVTHGRMAVGGINANAISQTAAPLAVLCAYLGLYASRQSFRKVAIGAFALLFVILLLTGSRGGILTAIVGCLVLSLPLTKRPGTLLAMGLLLLGCTFVAFEVLSMGDEARAVRELTKDTRSGIWRYALRRFEEYPLLGRGWLSQPGGRSWATVQSAFLQVLVETGLVGAALLGVSLLGNLVRLMRVRRTIRMSKGARLMWYFTAACLAETVFHGLIESSMIVGTSLTPLLWGFGVGMVDALPRLARSDAGAAGQAVRWYWIWVPDVSPTRLQPSAPPVATEPAGV